MKKMREENNTYGMIAVESHVVSTHLSSALQNNHLTRVHIFALVCFSLHN